MAGGGTSGVDVFDVRKVRRLVELMNELVSTFRTTFANRELRFSCNCDNLWVDGDRARLQQIVNNLLGNALKYSDETDGIWVELSGDERELCLSVRDAGRGIDARWLPDIFTAFVQKDRELNTEVGFERHLVKPVDLADLTEIFGARVRA